MVPCVLDEEGICALGEQPDEEGKQEMEFALLKEVQRSEPNGIGGYTHSTGSYPQIRQCAFSPDEQLRSLTTVLPPLASQELPSPYWEPQFQSSDSYQGIQAQRRPVDQTGALQNPLPESIYFKEVKEQLQSLTLTNDDGARSSLNSGPNVVRYPQSSSKSRSRLCHFHFFRGYCKKGANCQFFHGRASEVHTARQAEPFVSLKKLDMEIRELLTGIPPPVPVDLLPSMYFEMYGGPLRPDGWLTESQRHERAGCRLTSLLSQLNTIRVIEREHGQYYVVLVEDVPKYMDCLGFCPSCNLMDTGTGSNQIYMTFPVHSKFTEDDVENYFKRYGPVSGVRIPYQEKRMFGFVSFLYTETVRLILSKGTAHFICGSRVLVKRYMEKPELRKLSRKNKHIDYREHRISGCNVTNEHNIGFTMRKLSHKPDCLDETSAYKDSDEVSLPDSLGLY
ncbi:putative zinc finger CCCH domain-containing protein 51 isoform X2 [Oryza brachyantha]|uniref:putative zinc finger CCCH domain-containing protein 51 isoform X2 n=1 Tax=Oryza brachyantha TaxID=4533 RepID=UPI0003EABF93|nr:putative zinc finger CCCH domain-containing protein 51 isoform X2 [Oryza brachyantha]